MTVELSEQELKLIIAALRQTRHTFSVAERQEGSVAPEYAPVREAYDALHDKLVRLLEPPGPRLVR